MATHRTCHHQQVIDVFQSTSHGSDKTIDYRLRRLQEFTLYTNGDDSRSSDDVTRPRRRLFSISVNVHAACSVLFVPISSEVLVFWLQYSRPELLGHASEDLGYIYLGLAF